MPSRRSSAGDCRAQRGRRSWPARRGLATRHGAPRLGRMGWPAQLERSSHCCRIHLEVCGDGGERVTPAISGWCFAGGGSNLACSSTLSIGSRSCSKPSTSSGSGPHDHSTLAAEAAAARSDTMGCRLVTRPGRVRRGLVRKLPTRSRRPTVPGPNAPSRSESAKSVPTRARRACSTRFSAERAGLSSPLRATDGTGSARPRSFLSAAPQPPGYEGVE